MFYDTDNIKIHNENCLATMERMQGDSIDSIICDPPYGLGKEPDALEMLRAWVDGETKTVNGSGFMGKKWDAFVPQPEIWKAAFRVLKPGGYLLSFFGTRTYDWGVMSIRLGGFEIRDSVAWIYGSGFPKNRDIGKAIDQCNAENDRELRFTSWMRQTGLTAKQLNDATDSFMGSHYLTDKEQPAIPTKELWQKIRPLCKNIPVWVDKLVDRIEAEREVIGKEIRPNGRQFAEGMSGFARGEIKITAPSTKQAKQWHGWGTALKPAMELIVVARKPLSEKTVAKNVLKWGTGGINIEECRVEASEEDNEFDIKRAGYKDGVDHISKQNTDLRFNAHFTTIPETNQNLSHINKGRWPANVILDGSEEVRRGFPDRDGELHNKKTTGNSHFVPGLEKSKRGYSFKDTGSASRFFYNAKCSKMDREEGLGVFPLKERTTQGRDIVKYIDRRDGKGVVPVNGQIRPRSNDHPCVKPTNLMKYLCTLTTQPGGVIYDPFMGSGSTGKAALLEKFRFIGSEINQEDCEIAKARIIWASKQLKQLTLFEGLRN